MHNDIKPFFICICKLSLNEVGFDFFLSGLGQVVLITAANPFQALFAILQIERKGETIQRKGIVVISF